MWHTAYHLGWLVDQLSGVPGSKVDGCFRDTLVREQVRCVEAIEDWATTTQRGAIFNAKCGIGHSITEKYLKAVHSHLKLESWLAKRP